MNKEYLGDSVYAQVGQGFIILTTENGKLDDPSNEIFMDDSVIKAFLAYIIRIGIANMTFNQPA